MKMLSGKRKVKTFDRECFNFYLKVTLILQMKIYFHSEIHRKVEK